MATTFKSHVTSGVGSSYTAITPAVGTGKTLTILGVSISNVSGAPAYAYLKVVKSGGTPPNAEAHIAYNLELPASTGYEFNEGNKHILQQGDALQLKSATGASVLEAVVNYLEIS